MRHWFKQRGFNPNSVGVLELWLDAADSSSYTLSGSTITALTDKSPNDHSITVNGDPQLETATLNGLDSFRLDTSDYFIIGGVSDWVFIHYDEATIFLVYESHPGNTNPGSLEGILWTLYTTRGFAFALDDRSGSSKNDAFYFYTLASSGTVSARVTSTASNNELTPDAPHLIVVECDIGNATAADRILYEIDGTAGSGANDLTNSPSSGNSNYALYVNRAPSGNWHSDGRFHEVLIYSEKLTATQKARVVSYLEDKWNV